MKRLIKVWILLLLVMCMIVPARAHAAGKVKVKYHGVSKNYSGKITTVYINGKKKTIRSGPVFKKDGTYVGSLSHLLVNSAFKVKYKNSGKKAILTYKGKKLTLVDGSRNVVVNGVKEKKALGTIAMRAARYTSSGYTGWIVPLKSVCKRLRISYQVKSGAIYLGKTALPASTSKTKEGSDNTKTSAVNTKTSSAASAVTTSNSVDFSKPSANKQVILVLDAGHGGVDSGAVGSKYKEKNLTLAIILAAKQYFDKDTRFKVYYTRTTDAYPSLSDRSKLANNNNADLFISVHINSASSSATGTETLYNNSRLGTTGKNGVNSKELAQAMQNAVLKSTGFRDRGLVNRTGLWVLNKTTMPACLIEYGFISNSKEESLMYASTSKYGKDLYEAIAAFAKAKGLI
ncbi:MAG: N-acetylmuramoyl-L-alanine amidase [Eubacterium sp.]|nr:N-acetylmuramoyl-L-alanine amidase [Eubacterium sp.]